MKPSEILARAADVAQRNDDWMSFVVLADFCLEHGHRYERVAPYGRALFADHSNGATFLRAASSLAYGEGK